MLHSAYVYYTACRDNGVRLVGSSNVFEGTVEVCVGSIWGLIADTEWNDTDAQVACGELGFPKQGMKKTNIVM